MIKSLIVICLIFIHTAFAFSIEYETLIDFTKFESRIDNENLYDLDNEQFRLDYFTNPKGIEENRRIQYKASFVPWFKITPMDMAFNRWVISYRFPQSYHNPKPKLTNRNKTPFAMQQNLNYFLPAAKIFFPTIAEDMTATVSPPYDIYPFNKNGKLTNVGNGVLLNVGEIEKVLFIMGFKKGNISDIMLTLTLEDFKGREYDFPLGFMFSEQDGIIKYYRNYDGLEFREADEVINKDKLKGLELYYKVIFKKKTNEEIESEIKDEMVKRRLQDLSSKRENIDIKKEKLVLWTMVKNQREVYSEVHFEWSNSDYLKPYKKIYDRKELYPNEIPFIKFKNVKIKRQGGSKRQFYLFFKEIKLKYEDAVPDMEFSLKLGDENTKNDIDADILDDLEWQILKQYYLEKRQMLEAKHAMMMYKTFKLGWKKGFTNYEMFKNLYLFRFPPEKVYNSNKNR